MSNDTIKRSDAIKAVWGEDINPSEDGMVFEAQSHIDRDIRLIPSADRPQGEWIRDRYWSRGVGMGEEYGFFYKCSLCEYEIESGYTRCGFNFCPYCGADMREKEGE